ncbi:MAG: hypothetical protein LBL75_01750 [Rickettsiales bacterium]|jgi:hypothetical protein|nr:hypothetical protein [Rickettsiales bacterium]
MSDVCFLPKWEPNPKIKIPCEDCNFFSMMCEQQKCPMFIAYKKKQKMLESEQR